LKRKIKQNIKTSFLAEREPLRIFSSLLVLAVLLSGCTVNTAGAKNQPAATFFNDQGFETVTVSRIVDGDTIVVLHEDGTKTKVRFIGIDCPETVKKNAAAEFYADEATAYTTATLLDKTIYLQKDTSETDKYGRQLRYIWLTVPEKITQETIEESCFDALLLAGGFAEVMTIIPDDSYSTLFEEIEAEAIANQAGMFGT
jgi:micrococcal nuclease